MTNMLKGKPDSEEKIKQLEERKRKDEAEMQVEMNERKTKKTQEIKDQYKASDIKISFETIRDAMRIWGQLRPQTAANSVVKETIMPKYADRNERNKEETK